MNGRKVSIVTIAYNCLSDLRRTVQSVFDQDLDDYIEYIVIDGNSSDGTIEYLDNLSSSGKIEFLFLSESDEGIADAMNKGLMKSSGDWVCFLHAGDTFSNNLILKEIICHLIDTQYYYYTNINIVSSTGEFIRLWNPPAYNWSILKMRNFIPHQSVFFRVDMLKLLGGFNTDIRIAMDYDLWLRSGIFGYHGKKIDTISVNFLDGGASSYWKKMLKEERVVRLKNIDKGYVSTFYDLIYTSLRYFKNRNKSS